MSKSQLIAVLTKTSIRRKRCVVSRIFLPCFNPAKEKGCTEGLATIFGTARERKENERGVLDYLLTLPEIDGSKTGIQHPLVKLVWILQMICGMQSRLRRNCVFKVISPSLTPSESFGLFILKTVRKSTGFL